MISNSLKRVVVTGAAGFIGSSLVDSLLKQGIEVLGIDNFTTGRVEFLREALKDPKFTLLRQDLYLGGDLSSVFVGKDAKHSLIFYDKVIYPMSKVLDILGFRFILGKNLLLIATKLETLK